MTSIRTSGDHGYLVPPELLWAWFLYTNALVRPLGLWPYKDVFRSDGHGGSTDPGAEAALAALSGGPVGIGDALGGADRDLVMRTARRDGLLVAPDAPVAAIARCFARHGVLQPEPVVGATHTVHDAGRWSYVITMHCHADSAADRRRRCRSSDLGADAPADADGVAVRRRQRAWTGAAVRSTAGRRAGARRSSSAPGSGTCGCWHRGCSTGASRCSATATATRPRVASVCPTVRVDRGDAVQVRVAGADEPVTLVGLGRRAPTVRAEVRSGGAAAVTEATTAQVGGRGRWELPWTCPPSRAGCRSSCGSDRIRPAAALSPGGPPCPSVK